MPLTMFVDPGLGGTGVAVFQDIKEGLIQPPIWYDRITIPREQASWLSRSVQVATWIQVVIQKMRERKLTKWEGVIVEFPEVWGGSLKSNTAVRGGKNGNAPLLKLASLAGMVTYSFLMGMKATSSPNVQARYIKPGEWKGQLKKELVIQRIRRAYGWVDGEPELRDHEADAVGMGLAFQKGGKV